MERPEDAQEDFLREVERFVVIAEKVERELVDHPLMLADEFGAGVFVAGGAALDEGGFPAPDLGPGDGGNRLHGESFRHLTTPRSMGNLSRHKLRTRPALEVPRRL